MLRKPTGFGWISEFFMNLFSTWTEQISNDSKQTRVKAQISLIWMHTRQLRNCTPRRKKRICNRIRCLGETVFLVYAKKKNENHFKILRNKSWIWVVKMKILSKHSNHDASELKEISLNLERMVLRVRCKMDAIVRLSMDFRARLSNTFKYL